MQPHSLHSEDTEAQKLSRWTQSLSLSELGLDLGGPLATYAAVKVKIQVP